MVKPPLAPSIDTLIDEALTAQKGGDLENAIAKYDHALSLDPEHAEALHFLGLCHHQKGDHDKAIPLLVSAVTKRPDIEMFHFNLGLVQSAAGDLASATATFANMFETGVRSPELLNAYAVALKNSGDWEMSEHVFRMLLADHPKSIDGHYNLGNLYLRQGRAGEAQRLFEAAMALAPDHPDITKNYAAAVQRSGETARAQAILEDHLKVSPNDAGALINLGVIYRQIGRLTDATALLRRATEHSPHSAEAHYNLGAIYATQNKIEDAREAFIAATRMDAAQVSAKWASVLTLPQIYGSEDQIAEARADVTEGLQRLTAAPLPNRVSDLAPLLAAAEERTLFSLAYQGLDDKPLMSLWGRFIHSIAARALPELAEPIAGSVGHKLRIGFASAHWREHTIEKLFSRWMTSLRPDQFDVHLISTIGPGDATTKALSNQIGHAHTSARGTVDLATFIRGLKLDVIIYSDIGMDPRSQFLAALRLAPCQLVAFGHPVTTGLPTVDGFLTSDLMETEHGDTHYTEDLVRLPNLGVEYARPAVPEGPFPAHDFLCAQSLFKILPRQDDVFAQILGAAPGASLAFFAHPIPEVTAAFETRLSSALRKRHLDPEKRLVFIPPCERETFLKHLAGAKVVLDTFAWSGGNTSLETLAMGTPVITMPGDLMRSRHSAAMLQRAELDEWIVGTPDEYVERAVSCLFADAQLTASIATLSQNSVRLYHDTSPSEALSAFCLSQRH